MDDYEILDFLTPDQVERLREMGVLNETRLRDAGIKGHFRRLRHRGVPSGAAITALANRYGRSRKTVERVVYDVD